MKTIMTESRIRGRATLVSSLSRPSGAILMLISLIIALLSSFPASAQEPLDANPRYALQSETQVAQAALPQQRSTSGTCECFNAESLRELFDKPKEQTTLRCIGTGDPDLYSFRRVYISVQSGNEANSGYLPSERGGFVPSCLFRSRAPNIFFKHQGSPENTKACALLLDSYCAAR